MERIAEFFKVSYDQFKKDWLDTFCEPNDDNLRNESYIMDTYDLLHKPVRATSGSAGYDFFCPLGFTLEPGEEIKIPTGMRTKIDNGWLLMCCPKSGIGFKYYVRLANTLGIIDEDYAYSDNEGHIFCKIRNEGDKPMKINRGDKFFQAIFIPYGVTKDDEVKNTRNGGFGSTGR